MITFHAHQWLPSSTRAILLGLLLVSGCNRRASDEEGATDATVPPVVPVHIGTIERGDAIVAVSATGKTDAIRKEKIFSPLAGRIISLKALEGTPVHKGDVLATIRPKETQAAITGAEALLKRARTPSQQEEARKALELAESSQNNIDIRAGFDGMISSRAVAEEELVGENAELFTLVDLSSLVFFADVPLSALPNVRAGASAEIRFSGLPDRAFHGVVEALSPQSDPQSQTVRARLRFVGPVPGLFRTEMAGSAKIVIAVHQRALLAPRAALLRDDEHNTYSIVMVTSDSIARILPVSVGTMSDSTVEITSGAVQAGMWVVVEGNYSLADSTKVSIAGVDRP